MSITNHEALMRRILAEKALAARAQQVDGFVERLAGAIDDGALPSVMQIMASAFAEGLNSQALHDIASAEPDEWPHLRERAQATIEYIDLLETMD
ncbi:MAG: hypothetical protein ACP5DX_03945 [Paracoccaceae bacterium]